PFDEKLKRNIFLENSSSFIDYLKRRVFYVGIPSRKSCHHYRSERGYRSRDRPSLRPGRNPFGLGWKTEGRVGKNRRGGVTAEWGSHRYSHRCGEGGPPEILGSNHHGTIRSLEFSHQQRGNLSSYRLGEAGKGRTRKDPRRQPHRSHDAHEIRP